MRWLPDLRSLKIRLLLLAAGTIGITLLVAGGSLSLIFERHMLRRVADELSVRWTELAGAVALGTDGKVTIDKPPADPRYGQPLSGAYWQVTGPDGLLLRSRSLWDHVLSVPADAPADEAFETEGFEPESEFYIVSRPVTLEGTGVSVPVTLTVVLDHEELEALSEAFNGDLVKALVSIAAALFIGAAVQAHIGLGPLRTIRERIGAIRSGRSTRMGDDFPSEIQPLADDLDRLLDRQDTLIERARDRAGALAHGFKTPLTILTLEARRLAERGDVEGARLLREQIEVMRRHVERELARARIRGAAVDGSALGAARATELSLTVRRLVDTVRRLPFAERLDFTVEVPADARIRMDRDDFGEVLGNLLDNARKFAVSAVAVRAVPEAEHGCVRIEVCDDGPGFDRAASPERNHDGSGLGLAIVADVLGAYGSDLQRERRDGWTVLAFSVPAAEQGWDERTAAA